MFGVFFALLFLWHILCSPYKITEADRISSILESSYDDLTQVDARNDSQLLLYDQIIPGSILMGYLNADHWTISVPIARTHPTIGSMFVDKNDYPREALLEAISRLVEEDLLKSDK